MSILDTTIVNVALDDLGHELHSTLAQIQWVVTGYMLALAAVIPVTGWAARRFGAKRVWIMSLILFTAGSALCGLATTTNELIAFRVLQGVGGGMILPIGQLMMADAAGSGADGPGDEHRRRPRDAGADSRPDDRRADPRQRELAMDLLRQPPDRHDRGDRLACGCCRATRSRGDRGASTSAA